MKKKVLLVSPRFFNYHKIIKKGLEEKGYDVHLMEDKPNDNVYIHALLRFFPYRLNSFFDNYYLSKLNSFGSSNYDFILVINGQTLSKKIKKILKKDFPKSKFIMYRFDSLKNRPLDKIDLSLFDYFFSFDKFDCIQNNFTYRPLFYPNNIYFLKKKKSDILYDYSFVGTVHSDRFEFLYNLRKNLVNLKSFYYLYLKSKPVYYFQKYTNKSFKNSTINDFRFKSLDYDSVITTFLSSKVVIDIQHPFQTGLTMRSIEVLGTGRKLITTNKSIMDEDFYDPNLIMVVNRKKPEVKIDFFNNESKPLPKRIKKYLSLDGFLNTLFDIS